MTKAAHKVPRAIATEKKTVAAMVRIYCAEHHTSAAPPCTSCAELERYSHARLDACPYGAGKPTCKACPIHCYKPAERAAMREVMRFAGPRMMLWHPWLSIVHLWKERLHKAPRRRVRLAPSAKSLVESPRHYPDSVTAGRVPVCRQDRRREPSPAGRIPPAMRNVAGGDHVR